jgi:hypothetical protein
MKLSVRFSFRLGSEQERIVDRPAEFHGSDDITTKMRDNDKVGHGHAVRHKMSTCCQSDIHNTVVKSEIRDALKENERGKSGVRNSNFDGRNLIGLVGCIGHDGISRSGRRRSVSFASNLALKAF